MHPNICIGIFCLTIKIKVKAMSTEEIVDLIMECEIDDEIIDRISELYFLRHIDNNEINRIIRWIWCWIVQNNYVPTKEDMEFLKYKISNYLLKNCIPEYYEFDFTSKEKNYRNLAVDFLVNVFESGGRSVDESDETIYHMIICDKEDVFKRIDHLSSVDIFKPLFEFEDEGKDMFHKLVLEKFGVDLSTKKPGSTSIDINTDIKVEKPKNISKKELKEDKRIKYKDILMIDVNTMKAVKTFKSREELINELNVNKSTLCDCIRSTKDPNVPKWRKWKSSNGKKYYFKEKTVDNNNDINDIFIL